ncbi:MAG: T9SS type A sorting domain-containing protein [Candidatus Kapabacteria bacterium]|nr:T9SS type A sorting domain-containing protein [Candidatus Kapabacteria bacterium]
MSNDDQVRLYDRSGKLIDSVDYSYIAPWPTACDGTGRSMELINPFRSNLYGEYWKASGENLGSPGRENAMFSSVREAEQFFNDYSGAPNPASENTMLNFSLGADLKITASLYNSKGQKIQSLFNERLFVAGSHSYMIDSRNLRNGAYYVLIESNADSRVVKFVVVR